jgi:chromosome segregation ATPase
MRDNFYGEIQELEGTYRHQLDELHRKVDYLNSRVQSLEQLKNHLSKEQDKIKVREEYHREKLRHQEIESLMLEKYSKYESELNEQKRANDRLIQELTKANRTI